jgi:hypothetical protein
MNEKSIASDQKKEKVQRRLAVNGKRNFPTRKK